jgi:hypothetical protein
MKSIKNRLLVLIILGLLLLINIGLLAWNGLRYAALHNATTHYKAILYQTNNVSGVMIVDTKNDQPVWLRLNYPDGKPSDISLFAKGKKVMNAFLDKNGQIGYEVIFHENNGKAQAWYDHGHQFFTDRLFYDTNDDFSRMEVWCDQAWQRVTLRNDVKGIVVNGRWQSLYFTNGMWTLDSTTALSTDYFK